GHVTDGAHLACQVAGKLVHVVGKVSPNSSGPRYVGLAAELAFYTDVAGDARDLIGEGRQRYDHVVDGFDERRNLALRVQGQLLLQVAVGDGGDDPGDASYLFRQVQRHHVHVVGQLTPGARDATYFGESSQNTVGAYLTRYARHFVGKGAQLVDHGIHGVLQL